MATRRWWSKTMRIWKGCSQGRPSVDSGLVVNFHRLTDRRLLNKLRRIHWLGDHHAYGNSQPKAAVPKGSLLRDSSFPTPLRMVPGRPVGPLWEDVRNVAEGYLEALERLGNDDVKAEEETTPHFLVRSCFGRYPPRPRISNSARLLRATARDHPATPLGRYPTGLRGFRTSRTRRVLGGGYPSWSPMTES